MVPAIAVSLLSFALYVLLGQDLWYGDCPALLLGSGGVVSNHLAYMPSLGLVGNLLSGLGISLFRAGLLLSALGAALGAGIFHLASRRELRDPVRAWSATLLVAFAPPVLFFATVIELHAPFFAWASLAFLVSVRCERTPGHKNSMLLGLVCGISYAFHSTGALLPVLFAPRLYWLSKGNEAPSPRKRILLIASYVLTQLAVMALLNFLWKPRSEGGSDFAGLAFFLECASHALAGLSALPHSIWAEWFGAYLPAALLGLIPLFLRPARREATLLCAALVPYLLFTFLILSDIWPTERGAYLLPLVFPLAILLGRSLPRPLLLLAVLASLGLGVRAILVHDHPERLEQVAAAIQEESETPSLFLMVTNDDVGARFRYFPDREAFWFFPALAFDEAAMLASLTPAIDARFDALLQAGTRLLFSKDGVDLMRKPERTKLSGPSLVLAHLEQRYRLRPVGKSGMLFELRKR